MMKYVIEMRDITKRFPGVLANDCVSIRVKKGTVFCLVGENGAGKSTLMNILYGMYKSDSGQILLQGNPVTFHSSADAIDAGIGMVHQHFMISPELTVLENIILGSEPVRRGLINWDHAQETVLGLCRKYDFPIPLLESRFASYGDTAENRNTEDSVQGCKNNYPGRTYSSVDSSGN